MTDEELGTTVPQQLAELTKLCCGFSPDTPDSVVRDYWMRDFPDEVVEKPCGLIGWCPYGPLVEDFPLHPKAAECAVAHDKYVRWEATPQGLRPDGKQYPGRWVECGPDEEGAQPDLDFAVGKIDEPSSCGVFGHDCPVFYVAEPLADLDAIAERLCDGSQAMLERNTEE